MNTIILPVCPKCGCNDIRYEMWVGYKCFKCGHVEKKEEKSLVYSDKEGVK